MEVPQWFMDVLETRLPDLKGSSKQVKWASNIRAKELRQVWLEGFHGTVDSFVTDCLKLPIETSWWIENSLAGYPDLDISIKILKLMGRWYITSADSEY